MRTSSVLTLALVFTACEQEYEIVNEPVDVDPAEVTECDFTQVESSDFFAYDCNPVFQGTGEAWSGDIGSIGFHTTQVSGHPFYQMWYTADATSGAAYELGYELAMRPDWVDIPLRGLLSLIDDGG